MKNYLTNLFNSSVFRYVQRMAVVCLFLSYAASATAGNTYYGKCIVKKATGTGNGKVYVTANENTTPGDSDYGDPKDASDDKYVMSGSSAALTFYAYTKPDVGYYHVGWSTNANGSSPIANSNQQPYQISITAISTNSSSPTTKTYYAVFKEQTVYYDYAHAEVILIDGTGNILKDPNDDYIRDGGWVAINEEASNAPTFTVGGTADANIKTYNGDKAEWTYVYYAKADEANDYEFVGWYSATTLNKQLTDYGVIGPNIADNTNKMYSRTYTSTIKYSNKANAPKAETMYAVFRKTQTYYHYGVSVNIAGDEFEREAKGRVYADNGEAGSNANVTNDMWIVSKRDDQVYSQKNKDYTYYYYAKSLDPTKIAFKGWATTPSGEVSYVVAEGEVFSYTHTVTSENMSPEKPYRTPTFYAVFESHYYKTPSVAVATPSLGSGYVHVSLTPSSVDQCTREQIPVSDETYQVAANNRTTPYKVYYYAKPRPGAQFVGWSSTPDGLNIISQNPEEVVDCETSSTNANIPQVEAPRYAVFRSDIDIRQQDRMIVYVDDEGNGNINDSKVLIDFQKGNTLTATLSGADASYFTLSNRSGSKSGSNITFDATQGLIELVVTYTGDLAAAVGKVANITLSATYGGQTITRPVAIVVEEAPIITFLPTDGKGAYTVKMTNGSGVNYTMDASAKEELKVAVTHESMSNIEMALTSDVDADEYYFFGWQMIDEGNVTYLSYEDLTTYQFTKAVKVKAEFVHKDIATYSIVGDPNKILYHDFALVMKDAERLVSTNGTQTVLLNDVAHGDSVKSAILPKGNYTIPANVRFIIPGKGLYDYREDLESTDFYKGTSAEYKYASASSFKKIEHIRWIVEEGTTITISAGSAICVQSMVASIGADNPNGLPFSYGHIELKENCNLNFLGGSKLISFGYVTGPKSSSIVMNDGSRVKEFLQVYDWRGGTATSTAYLTQKFQNNKIFLINQYFVQNIEAPLTIKAGAEEILEAGIAAGDDPVRMPLTFISQNDGFFQLGSGYSITKYYDVNSDRIQFSIDAENGATGSVELGSIILDISGLGTVSSADYVLPLPHNYDVILGKNTKTNVLYDVAFLPGSTLYVSEGAEVNLGASSNANVFVYDKKYSTIGGTGYCGAQNKEFYTIKTRPDGIKYVRNSASIQDAKFVVDGIIKTSNGYLYTTNSTSETVDHATIISNGGGKVVFNSLGTVSNTKQGQYTTGLLGGTIEAVTVPVSPARLLNATGTYQVPAANTTYTYVNGLWKPNTSETERPNIPTPVSYVPMFNVTDYTTSTYVHKTSTGTTTIATNNPNVNWTSADLTWTHKLYGEHANQFSYTMGAKSASTVPVTIKFTPTSDGVKTATLRITATYKYTDNYGVKGTYIYSKDIHLTGNASYLNANTLAFADLSTLYFEQSNVGLFQVGSKNNAEPITITITPNTNVKAEERGEATASGDTETATITPTKVGSIVITAEQNADINNNIAATKITKIIEVNDRVQWNWDLLYLGERYDTPITVLDGSTGWTLTETKDEFNILNFQGTAPNYTASVADLIVGEFDIEFTFTQNGQSRKFTSHVIVDPRHLRVDVNSETIFRAVTLSANESVGYNVGQNGQPDQIIFRSTNSNISQWKLGFFGVPDKIHFQPNGISAWQIEESPNGVNWTTSFPWKYIDANIDFELSLLPSTRYLRISYGAGSTTPASLKELYITELTDVKADVEKLYVPVQKDANGSVIPYTKEIVLTYANTAKMYVSTTNPTVFKVKESTSTNAATDVLEIPATSEDNPFGIKGIEVVSTADKEMEGYLEIREGTTLKVQIPIQTYLFPQELPIKLATDKPDGGDRYYYVTTHTHNAEWDGRDNVRTITLHNAVSDAAPYLTFEYSGNPTYIGFNYSTTAKGTWELEQYINNNWAFVPHTPDNGDVMDPDAGTFKRFVDPNASKLRVIYQSEYAEKVDITDLVIVGDASAIVEPARMELDYDDPKDLKVTAINLPELKITSTNPNFTVAYNNGTPSSYESSHALTSTEFGCLDGSGMDDILLHVKWLGSEAIEHGTLELTATINGVEKLLATVELVGMKAEITQGDLGISTGVAPGYTLAGKYKDDGVTLTGKWQGDDHRPVNIDAAFAPNGAALFDYVVVYGETTTSDGSQTINLPNTLIGSNAKTPCYIYKKEDNTYKLYKSVENANSKEKSWNNVEQDDADAVTIPEGADEISMYITGFCPYASTGYTKADEGVWYFRANAGQKIDVYLQDCYIYSRAKTHDGHSFVDRKDGNSFSSVYTCGSGAVLVFACNDKTESVNNPMNVTIYTLDNNLLKSNYGCFLQSAAGRVYHVSPSVQIRLIDDTYYIETTTTLNFTDKWPASKHRKTGADKRTNGFLSLQKQHNNAPSIDMGNENTVVNFNGGQVELQNAQIVSTNYVTTLAICHRTGRFAGIPLAYGLGTDGVGGTVNFNDGTTTVLPMEVDPNYRQYYLMDTDAAGNALTTTSCLRTPQNTFVTGGSHCMMRACTDPTSKGGAPKDKPGNDGKLLGLYKFPKNPASGKKGGWTEGENGLVIVVTSDMDPVNHQVPEGYGVKSVTPNTNGTANNDTDDFLNFWFDPDFEPSAKPEINVPITFWKTCMTQIAAQYGGYGGSVGGNTSVAMAGDMQNEEVINLMYCKIDEQILAEISKDSYQAPVKNPGQVGEAYLPVHPSQVGEETAHYITNEKPFQVEGKIYYITTATADVWKAFTAPFDVANIYIMETYPEKLLQDMEGDVVDGVTIGRSQILLEQAKHNADFAAFFAVTVALGQQKDFETIYREYIDWAKLQDKASGAWDGRGTYTLRGKSALVPYNGSNWETADFYLNENVGVWEYTGEEGKEFKTKWEFANASDGKLMQKGMTYSMLLPFCTKCGEDIEDREFWDYWSGKFLIFESTDGPHIVDGTAAINEVVAADPTEFAPNSNDAKLTGNHTFNAVNTAETYIWNYVGNLQHSTFSYNRYGANVNPTESFLIANIPSRNSMPARGVTTSGQVIYDTNGDGTMTDIQRPGVSEGHSLFITSTAEGINIAVAEAQHVRVMSATGIVLYNGMVQTAVDVALPSNGVYVITGETEVHKILF